MTGIGARLAGARSITTHVPRGGSIEEPASMLESTFGTERSDHDPEERAYNRPSYR